MLKISITIIIILNSILCFAEDNNDNKKNNNSKSKWKKPDHIIITNYNYTGADQDESHGCNLHVINTFNINKESSITNIFNFLYLNNQGNSKISQNLYMIKDILFFQHKSATLMIGYTMNSDKPYNDFDDVSINSSILIEIYKEGFHSFKIGLLYSSQLSNSIGYYIPIPIFTYSYNTRKLKLDFGIFLNLVWNPVKYFTLRLRYFLAITGTAEFVFKPLPFILLSTVFDSKSNAYLINNRDDIKERLFHDYMQVGERITFYVSKFAAVFIYGGYRFYNKYTYADGMFRELTDDYRLKLEYDNSFELKTGITFIF